MTTSCARGQRGPRQVSCTGWRAWSPRQLQWHQLADKQEFLPPSGSASACLSHFCSGLSAKPTHQPPALLSLEVLICYPNFKYHLCGGDSHGYCGPDLSASPGQQLHHWICPGLSSKEQGLPRSSPPNRLRLCSLLPGPPLPQTRQACPAASVNPHPAGPLLHALLCVVSGPPSGGGSRLKTWAYTACVSSTCLE